MAYFQSSSAVRDASRGKRRDRVLEHAIRDRLRRRRDVVRVRIVLRFARAIVRVADDVVRPQVVRRERHAISAVEADAHHPVEAPSCLFDQPRDECGIFAARAQPLGEGEHRVRRFARIDDALREIARIMPAAAHADALVAERGEPVEVIDAVRAGDGEAAALAIEEVERLPDRGLPHVVGDRKRARGDIARANHVHARLGHLGEIELLEFTDAGLHRLNRFPKDDFAERIVIHADQLEFAGRKPFATAVFEALDS